MIWSIIGWLTVFALGFLAGHQAGEDTARIEACQLQGGALLIDTEQNAVCMKAGLIMWRVK